MAHQEITSTMRAIVRYTIDDIRTYGAHLTEAILRYEEGNIDIPSTSAVLVSALLAEANAGHRCIDQTISVRNSILYALQALEFSDRYANDGYNQYVLGCSRSRYEELLMQTPDPINPSQSAYDIMMNIVALR